MPGHKMMQRRGTARIPPRVWRPDQSACIVSNSNLWKRRSGFKFRIANQPKYGNYFVSMYFSKICRRILFPLKSGKNNGYFIQRWTYIFDMSLISLSKKLQRKSKYSVTFSFLENCAVYEIMWKNTAVSGSSQMTIWRMRIACSIPKATNSHSGCVIRILPASSHKNTFYGMRKKKISEYTVIFLTR
jgi:hypothetical protein